MLERTYRATLRDLTTHALIAASFLAPLHIAYSFIFRDEIAVSALHDQIESLPAGEAVRRVGEADLTTFRSVGWALLVIEVLLLPLMVVASGHVLRVRANNELPSVRAALASIPRHLGDTRRVARAPGLLVPAAIIAVAVGLLARAAGLMMLEPLSDGVLWAGVALTETAARSLAAPFVMVPAAFAAWDN